MKIESSYFGEQQFLLEIQSIGQLNTAGVVQLYT